ncbi:MAG: thioester reductase domain-containing protein [Pseudoxanthomonas sp.]
MRHVFLTGATGYVGVFLLAELLSDPAAAVTVHCLLRGSSVAAAAARLQQKLAQYGLGSPAWASRIRYVLGDLAAPYLGLDPAAFDELAATIDVIYHSGAQVDHVRGYAVMKPSNVLGTQEILRLACRRRLKTVHHLSTLGVLYPPSYGGAAVAYETDVAGPLPLLPNGYMQSKCVAEHLVTTALARGIPAVIYRLGAITGHSQTGVCNLDDYFYGALRTAVRLQTSDPLNTDLTVTPVDFATRAILTISRRADALGRTFHVTHPEPLWWLDLMQWLRNQGYAITTRPYEECMTRLYAAARSGIEVPMHAFLPLLVQKRADSNRYVMEDYYVQVRYDCQNLLAALGDEVRLLPSPTHLLAVYLEYLRQHHLLAAPYPQAGPAPVADLWSTI